MDIADRSESIGIELNFNITNNLVAALNECSEYVHRQVESLNCSRWSQIYILESLMTFTPQNPGDAELIAERIAPRLQHANSGVVLTTIKVILYLTNYMTKDEDVISLCKKLSPPLGMKVFCLPNVVVTLLSKSPELQFVAIRNAQLILEKRPEILQNDIKVFFCKYNDPIYVKLAKLEVIVKLAHEENIDKVLEELKE
jgi:AP-2 complex subunit beta-1